MHKHSTGGASRQTGRGAPIYVGKVVVGHVLGDTFFKVFRGSVHILRQPRALANQVSALDDAEREGAVFVQETDSETNRVYRAPIALIRKRGIRIDRGNFGPQLALLLGEWEIDGQSPKAPPPPSERPQQLELWQ